MVERFNGRIAEVIEQTEFVLAKQLKETRRSIFAFTINMFPPKKLGYIKQVEALKNWQKTTPELFEKSVYDLAGLR